MQLLIHGCLKIKGVWAVSMIGGLTVCDGGVQGHLFPLYGWKKMSTLHRVYKIWIKQQNEPEEQILALVTAENALKRMCDEDIEID